MKNQISKWRSPCVGERANAWITALLKMPIDIEERSSKDIKALIHALRIRQLELQLQNEELQRKQRELQTSRDEYADLYDISPAGYITTSANGIILRANRTISILLGVENQALIGESLSRFIAKEALDLFHCYQKMRPETDGRRTCELVMLKGDGSRFDAQLDSIPAADSEGNFTQTRTIVLDVSKRKKMEKTLRESEAQSRETQKMAAIGIMAGGITHDFNNLLMVILGNIELVRERVRGDHLLTSSLNAAQRAGFRAAEIIKQLSLVSRQKDASGTPLRMSAVLEASMKCLKNILPAGIELKQNVSADMDTVVANEGRIHQVLSLLFDNAVEAIGEAGGQITISLNNAVIGSGTAIPLHDLSPARYLKLSVSDTGPGIDPSILDNIFTPYFTTKDFGKGKGFGLALVYGIIKNHNGRIFVSSEVGKGTTFDIYLPVIEKEGAPLSEN